MLGLMSTVTLEVICFRAYASLPALLPFCKCILEVVFCEGVQHRLRFCLHHLNCVTMAVFQFYLQSEKQRKVGWVGTTAMLLSVKNCLVKKEVCDGALS
jgi:hypothetical protein